MKAFIVVVTVNGIGGEHKSVAAAFKSLGLPSDDVEEFSRLLSRNSEGKATAKFKGVEYCFSIVK